jgi:ribulose-phosphate 3-epimerase
VSNKFEIIPFIASCNLLSVKDEILRLKNVKRLHIDIEDGNFVPNITFGIKMIEGIRSFCNKDLYVHLMVTNPKMYIESLFKYNIKNIAVHYECLDYPLEVINYIKKNGVNAGLALNFKTMSLQIKPFIETIDYVLIMTSEPDCSGQKFQNSMLEKIQNIKNLIGEKEIWVDGGIGQKELPLVLKAGAQKIIMGRAFFPAVILQRQSKIFIGNIKILSEI